MRPPLSPGTDRFWLEFFHAPVLRWEKLPGAPVAGKHLSLGCWLIGRALAPGFRAGELRVESTTEQRFKSAWSRSRRGEKRKTSGRSLKLCKCFDEKSQASKCRPCDRGRSQARGVATWGTATNWAATARIRATNSNSRSSTDGASKSGWVGRLSNQWKFCGRSRWGRRGRCSHAHSAGVFQSRREREAPCHLEQASIVAAGLALSFQPSKA